MSVKNSLDLDSDPRTIIGTRIIDAPRELVWKAWTDPKHLDAWWGPTGFTTKTKSFEMREGGIWRFVMHGPDGRDYENRIIFDEIVKPERILYRHDDGGENVESTQFKQTVTFEDIGGKTRLTWKAVFPSAEERERVIRDHGAGKGLTETMTRLEKYVAGLN